jgi:hypothetical protein
MKKTLFLTILMITLLSSIVFAAPFISYLKTQSVYPSNIQISWKISDDEGLSRLELWKDAKIIYKEALSGTHQTSVYQIWEDNKTHVFAIVVYNINNESNSLTRNRGSDLSPPNVTSPLKVISNKKQLDFTTNELAYCQAGFEQNQLVEVSKDYELTHSIALPFAEGQNAVFVKCSDQNDNIMVKPVIINFFLDTLMPGKVTNLNFSVNNNKIRMTWAAAKDNGGISFYNIYNSLQKIAFSSNTYWDVTTNDSFYYVTAVDKAGNEGERQEYSFRRELLLQPGFEVNKNETKVKETAEEVNETSTKGFVAWYIFGVLVIILIIWKVYEYIKDKHGFTRYLRQRRKLRESK